MTEAMTLNMSVFSAMETEEMYVVEGGTKEAAGVLIIGGQLLRVFLPRLHVEVLLRHMHLSRLRDILQWVQERHF